MRSFIIMLFAAVTLSFSIGMTRCSTYDENDDEAEILRDQMSHNEYDEEHSTDSPVNDQVDEAGDDSSYDIKNPPGVLAKCIFPSDPTPGALYAGKPRPVVVGIENQLSADNNYWVHFIYASLYHPKNKNQLLQNITATKYVQPVIAQSGSTFNYVIWLHDNFAEKNFTLVIFAHMTDDKREYVYPVYNETIRFMELPENTFDLKFLFMIVVLTTTSVIVSKLLMQKFIKKTKGNQRNTRNSARASMGNEIDDDWLPAELKKKNKSTSTK